MPPTESPPAAPRIRIHGNAKLGIFEVQAMRRDYHAGSTLSELAVKYHVSPQWAARVARGEVRREVPEEVPSVA